MQITAVGVSRGMHVLQHTVDPACERRRLRQEAHDKKCFVREIEQVSRMYDNSVTNAFRFAASDQAKYGNTSFGNACLTARNVLWSGLGTRYVQITLGGWDNHTGIFNILRTQRLPALDKGMSALVEDLNQRGLLKDTAIIWMGEFSRTPRINGNGGRDHWARAWSVVVGGAGLKTGITVGKTNEDGTAVETDPYTSQDVMATVCKALGIDSTKEYMARGNRPMHKVDKGAKPVAQLF